MPLRWFCALALVYCFGWLAVVLITGPENLVFGLPWALKGVLWIGTAVPLIALFAIYIAWRKRTALAVGAGMVLASYIPFVIYWNLHA
jgi:hypothetical protein